MSIDLKKRLWLWWKRSITSRGLTGTFRGFEMPSSYAVKTGIFFLRQRKRNELIVFSIELLMILGYVRGREWNNEKVLPKSWSPLGASLLKAVPDPPQLFCFKLLHQPCFIYRYLSFRYARMESHLLQRRTTKWKWDKTIARQRITHRQYVWKGLRARESCGGRRRPHRSSRPGARCCDDHRSPLSCPLEAEASNFYLKTLMRNGNCTIDLLWRIEVALTQWWLLPCRWHRCCWLSFAQLLR